MGNELHYCIYIGQVTMGTGGLPGTSMMRMLENASSHARLKAIFLAVPLVFNFSLTSSPSSPLHSSTPRLSLSPHPLKLTPTQHRTPTHTLPPSSPAIHLNMKGALQSLLTHSSNSSNIKCILKSCESPNLSTIFATISWVYILTLFFHILHGNDVEAPPTEANEVIT